MVLQIKCSDPIGFQSCLNEISELKKLAVLVTSLSYKDLIPYMSSTLPHSDIDKLAMELIEL